MHSQPDHYKALGLTSAASDEDIRKSFKKLAVQYHPDKNPGDEEAEELFKRISTAYRVLSDPERRKKYDNRLNWLFEYVTPDPEDDPEYRRKYGSSKRKNLKTREELDQEEILAYEEEVRQKPEHIRIALSLAVSLWGLQLIFSNWYLNEADLKIMLVVLGFALFVCGLLFFINILYRRLAIRNMKNPLSYNFQNRCLGLFMLLLVGGISGSILLSNLNRNYQLRYYGVTTVGYVDGPSYRGEVKCKFLAQGKLVKKTFDLEESHLFRSGDPVLVKYSVGNPNFAMIIGRP
jgi:hypothetical protein